MLGRGDLDKVYRERRGRYSGLGYTGNRYHTSGSVALSSVESLFVYAMMRILRFRKAMMQVKTAFMDQVTSNQFEKAKKRPLSCLSIWGAAQYFAGLRCMEWYSAVFAQRGRNITIRITTPQYPDVLQFHCGLRQISDFLSLLWLDLT